MLYAALIASEIIFWILLLGALAIRYGLRWRRTSTVLLYAIVVNELAGWPWPLGTCTGPATPGSITS